MFGLVTKSTMRSLLHEKDETILKLSSEVKEQNRVIHELNKELSGFRRQPTKAARVLSSLEEALVTEYGVAHARQKNPDGNKSSYMRGLSFAFDTLKALEGAK